MPLFSLSLMTLSVIVVTSGPAVDPDRAGPARGPPTVSESQAGEARGDASITDGADDLEDAIHGGGQGRSRLHDGVPGAIADDGEALEDVEVTGTGVRLR